MPWPSQACADKLDRELTLYGNPPQFPEEDPEQPLTVSCPAASSIYTKFLNVDPQPSRVSGILQKVSSACAQLGLRVTSCQWVAVLCAEHRPTSGGLS